MKYEINCESGEVIIREMNAEEIATEEIELAKNQEKENELLAKASKDAAAKTALLEKLGITEEEAKLLLS